MRLSYSWNFIHRCFWYAETSFIKGTDTAFQKYYPSYLVWFETIQHAFCAGKTLQMVGIL